MDRTRSEAADRTIGSALAILISGIYLVIGIDAAGQAWPKVAFASFLLMGPLSAMTGRRMRALRAACGAEGSWSVDLFSRLRDPILKMSLSLRVALFIGIFVLVSAKPGPVGSLSLIGTSVLVGLASSVFGWRGGPAQARPPEEPEKDASQAYRPGSWFGDRVMAKGTSTSV